jgi:YebC/PmpR family DNA-binding regulatory protein
MAGHSHWAGIKHKKALIDNKRGKLWSKLSKAIIVAAKTGGGDPSMNLRLRYAIDDARQVSMPKDNIQRAIKRGTGEIAGGELEEVIYEGYGPSGVAVMCEILTDNRNRTAPEIRKVFEMSDGKLGATNCVAWMFDRKGQFIVSRAKCSEERLMEIALEAGAEDIKSEGDSFFVTCSPDELAAVQSALENAGIEPEDSRITQIPSNSVDLDVESGRKVLKLMEALDDHEDVQNVYSNFNIPDAVLAEIESA